MKRGIQHPIAVVVAMVVAALTLFGGCPYSFTGASVPAHWKTIGIPLVDDRSGYGEPALREEFTTGLTNLFISDNSLQVTEKTSADALLEGVITRIVDMPSAVSGGEQVRTRRITMSVRFTLQDMKLRKKLWEKEFSNWGEYESAAGPSQVRVGLSEAMRKVTEDVLLETVSGW